MITLLCLLLSTQVSAIVVDKQQKKNEIIQYAQQFVGNPYVYSGNSLTAGCDCSHFVWNILKDTKYYNGEYAVSDGWVSLGQPVEDITAAVAGDVIVYPGHVAIYDGEGLIIQAQNSDNGITHNRKYDCDTILAIRHFEKILI